MLVSLASGIGEYGLESIVLCLRGEGPFPDMLRERGIRTRVLDVRKGPAQLVRAFMIIGRERADVLHSFLFPANILGRLSALAGLVPAAVSGQRSTDEWRRWYHWKMDALTAVFARMVISNSEAGKRVLVEKAGFPARRVLVVPNGVALPQGGEPARREDLGLERDCFVVGTVGNLRAAKGHGFFMEAAIPLARRFPRTRFLFVGEGVEKDALARKAEKAGVRSSFVFAGFRSDVPAVVKNMDIFVLPSLWEGCPVSLLEAMSLGRPVVATRVGDVPLIVREMKEGLLVPPGDPGSLRGAVERLILDEKLRGDLGKAARERIERSFTRRGMIARHARIYRDIARLQGCE